VNNVETLCCVSKILDEGPATFAQHGNEQSSRHQAAERLRRLQAARHLRGPVRDIRFARCSSMVGGEDATPSRSAARAASSVGTALDAHDLLRRPGHRRFDHGLRSGAQRARDRRSASWSSSIEESCGYCTPCRVGNVLLGASWSEVLAGRGEPADLD
jgi:[NiFe] hydrogenase diaphorase moiety large subunit